MNGADMLALARYTASRILAYHVNLDWENVPELDKPTFDQLDAAVAVVAGELAEQAGDRGRELWEATQ